jgi:hypothetical protein
VVTLLDPKEPLLDPPPVLEPPLLESLEPSLPLPDQLEMLDPLLVEVDLDLLLLLRCWSSLPLDLSVGSSKIFPPFLEFIASFFCLASANCVGSQLEMLDPLLVEVDLDLEILLLDLSLLFLDCLTLNPKLGFYFLITLTMFLIFYFSYTT